VAEAEALEERALSRFGFLPQFTPASAIQASSALLQLLTMSRILLPAGRVGTRAPLAQKIVVLVLAAADAAIPRLEPPNAAFELVVGASKLLAVVALHQMTTRESIAITS
jgi:hypothetical protein